MGRQKQPVPDLPADVVITEIAATLEMMTKKTESLARAVTNSKAKRAIVLMVLSRVTKVPIRQIDKLLTMASDGSLRAALFEEKP